MCAVGRTEAQSSTLKATFPFVASHAVVSENGTPPVAFTGFGGGVIALDVTDPLVPKPWTAVPQGGFLRAANSNRSGFAFDLCLTPTQLYVAAGVAGLIRYQRSNWARQQVYAEPNGLELARCVAAVEFGGVERVLVGTIAHASTSTVTPKLHLMLPSTSTPLASVVLPKPITSIAAYKPAGINEIRVVVGMACGGVARYRVPLGTGLTYETLELKDTWGVDTGTSTFVQDVVIDEARAVAYVATYGAYHDVDAGPGVVPQIVANARRGVYALKLDVGDTLTEVGGAWPIRPEQNTVIHYCQSLAFEPTASRLVVGTGPKLAALTQYSRNCTHAVPCDCSTQSSNCTEEAGCDISEQQQGVYVYSITTAQGTPGYVDGDPIYALGDKLTNVGANKMFSSAAAVSIRPGATNALYSIDIAGDVGGYRMARKTFSGAPLDKAGEFTQFNDLVAHPEQIIRLPVNTMDTIALRDESPSPKVAYVATEQGIATFDLQYSTASGLADKPFPANVQTPAPDDVLAVLDDFDLPPPDVGLEPLDPHSTKGPVSLVYAAPPHARLYGAATDGIRFANVDGPLATDPILVDKRFLVSDVDDPYARTFFIATAPALSMIDPPPFGRWVYASLIGMSTHGPAGTGGVAVLNVGAEGSTKDDLLTNVSVVAKFRHTGGEMKSIRCGGLTVVPVIGPSGPEHAVYVAYGPSVGDPQETETTAGLLILRVYLEQVTSPGGGTTWVPRFEFKARVPVDSAGANCNGAMPGMVQYDPGTTGVSPRLLVGLNCNGVAIYAVPSDPYAPYPIAYHTQSSVLSVVRGPMASDNTPYYYATYLNQGVGLLKLVPSTGGLPFDISVLHQFPTGFQAGQLVLANPERTRAFVCDLRGGVSVIEFTMP